MRMSKDPAVQKFLEEINMVETEKSNFLYAMREIVYKIHPKTSEKFKYGGILFSLNDEDYGGLFVSKHHVSFEFSKGYLMKDPKKILEGPGEFRRHLKIKSAEDINSKEVAFFVKQAI